MARLPTGQATTPLELAPFFCIGTQKTGTTLLARLLDQHPDLACVQESYLPALWAWPNLLNVRNGRAAQHGFAPALVERWVEQKRQALASVGATGLPHFTAQQLGLRLTLARVLPDLLGDFARRCGAKRGGDKWPWYIEHLDLLTDLFPRAQFIYTVRDPRGLWSSAQRFRNRGAGDQVLTELLRQERQVSPYLERPNFLCVRYEDLVCQPQQALARVYRFLGVTYEPDYLEYRPERDPFPDRWEWVKEAREPLRPTNASKWREHMTPNEIQEITARSSWFLNKYGYQAENVGLVSSSVV